MPQNYKEIRDARMAIKEGLHTGDFSKAGMMLGGKLKKYLTSPEEADNLQNALKLVLNSTYGIAAATFDNPLRDIRDKNNIIALRGALFMRTLQDEVQQRGFRVVHIKTDSIKISDATPDIIKFIIDFGRKYDYEFEHEATYDRMCLVNDAVYIAKYDEHGVRNKGGKHAGEWTATGTQFQVPYVFKMLFSHNHITFDDLCETKSVSTALYLDMNENLPDMSWYEKELKNLDSNPAEMTPEEREQYRQVLKDHIARGHDYHFVGRVGQFCPMKPGCGGGLLMRETVDKNTGAKGYSAATGSKGYRWMESEMVRELGKEGDIDRRYYETLVDKAKKAIEKYGDFEMFVGE